MVVEAAMAVEVKANLGRFSLAHNPTRTLLIKIILTAPYKEGWQHRLGTKYQTCEMTWSDVKTKERELLAVT